MPYQLKNRPAPKRRAKGPLSDAEKMEIAIRSKLLGEDPKVVVPPVYVRHDLTPPKHPAQPLSSFLKLFENRLAQDDAGALALAERFGIELKGLPAQSAVTPTQAE